MSQRDRHYIRRALIEMRARQQAVRPRYDERQIECDEARALARLAFETFGADGLVEFDTHPVTGAARGRLMLGHFTEPPPAPGEPKNPYRKRRFMFRGASVGELAAQVERWRQLGRPGDVGVVRGRG